MYTMEYYSAIRNDKYPPFASTWMELEGIIEWSKSVGEGQTLYVLIHLGNINNSEREYYSAIRNDKYPPFASTWMELEGIMLSEVSQSEKDKHYMFSFIWGI